PCVFDPTGHVGLRVLGRPHRQQVACHGRGPHGRTHLKGSPRRSSTLATGPGLRIEKDRKGSKRGWEPIDIDMSIDSRPLFSPSRVRVRIGLTDWLGAIVEDRGFIGVGRRRLWTVKLDSDSDPENERYIELPEAEMTLVE